MTTTIKPRVLYDPARPTFSMYPCDALYTVHKWEKMEPGEKPMAFITGDGKEVFHLATGSNFMYFWRQKNCWRAPNFTVRLTDDLTKSIDDLENKHYLNIQKIDGGELALFYGKRKIKTAPFSECKIFDLHLWLKSNGLDHRRNLIQLPHKFHENWSDILEAFKDRPVDQVTFEMNPENPGLFVSFDGCRFCIPWKWRELPTCKFTIKMEHLRRAEDAFYLSWATHLELFRDCVLITERTKYSENFQRDRFLKLPLYNPIRISRGATDVPFALPLLDD